MFMLWSTARSCDGLSHHLSLLPGQPCSCGSPLLLTVKTRVCLRKPRGTVPSTRCRDDVVLKKPSTERFHFGWSCMSRRRKRKQRQRPTAGGRRTNRAVQHSPTASPSCRRVCLLPPVFQLPHHNVLRSRVFINCCRCVRLEQRIVCPIPENRHDGERKVRRIEYG